MGLPPDFAQVEDRQQASLPQVCPQLGENTAKEALYGSVRYQSGTMPTRYGYTGQRADTATSGLDDYGARSYGPTVGQFSSADDMLAGGLNRYSYGGGNPTTLTDPSGHEAAPIHFDLEGSTPGNGGGGFAGLARVVLESLFGPTTAAGAATAASARSDATLSHSRQPWRSR